MVGTTRVGMATATTRVASSSLIAISFITTPVGIILYLMAGLAMLDALAEGPTAFFSRGSSSSIGENFLLATTRSSVYLL